MEVEINNLSKTMEVCPPVKVGSVWNSELMVRLIIPWKNNTEVCVLVNGEELVNAVKKIINEL